MFPILKIIEGFIRAGVNANDCPVDLITNFYHEPSIEGCTTNYSMLYMDKFDGGPLYKSEISEKKIVFITPKKAKKLELIFWWNFS